MKNFRFILSLAIFAALGGLLPVVSNAMVVKSGESVNVPAEETIGDNLFVAGSNVDISAPVAGDLFVVGSNVVVRGKVDGDVFIAAGNARIEGEVGGSVRAAAGQLELNNKVGRNVLAAAGTIIIREESKIAGQLTVAGGQIEFRGAAGGNLDAAAGVFNFYGTANNASLLLDNGGKLTFYPKAVVAGNLWYRAEKPAVIQEGAQVKGKTDFVEWKMKDNKNLGRDFQAAYLMGMVYKFISLFIVTLLMFWLIGKKTGEIIKRMRSNFGGQFLLGFAFAFLAPIAALILLCTVIGIPVALILLAAYGIAMYLAQVFAGLLLADWLKEKIKFMARWHWAAMAAIGILIFVVIGAIPVVGWIFKFILILFALGAILKEKEEMLKSWE